MLFLNDIEFLQCEFQDERALDTSHVDVHGIVDEDSLMVDICARWKPVDDKFITLHFSNNFDLSRKQN